jgi:hypothetical protein
MRHGSYAADGGAGGGAGSDSDVERMRDGSGDALAARLDAGGAGKRPLANSGRQNVRRLLAAKGSNASSKATKTAARCSDPDTEDDTDDLLPQKRKSVKAKTGSAGRRIRS